MTYATNTSETGWRGFHHVALATRDLDATIAFYGGVLGMRAGEVSRRGPNRHCFVTPGDGAGWGLHFFEHQDAQLFTELEEMRAVLTDPSARHESLPGALQHIAFALPDEAAALALRERLRARDLPVTATFDYGATRGFMFADLSGQLLEATWPSTADGDASRGPAV
jgi:catechol 2,3-dioxygenase-like lactoylglutathione lyase family enzyme